MASRAQLEANKANAQKSTGPTSDQGKRNSRMNALKHGLTARCVTLPNENPNVYPDRLEQWLDYYDTGDPAQVALIERAVLATIRLQRCARYETAQLSQKVRHAVDDHDKAEHARVEDLGKRLLHDPLNRCVH